MAEGIWDFCCWQHTGGGVWAYRAEQVGLSSFCWSAVPQQRLCKCSWHAASVKWDEVNFLLPLFYCKWAGWKHKARGCYQVCSSLLNCGGPIVAEPIGFNELESIEHSHSLRIHSQPVSVCNQTKAMTMCLLCPFLLTALLKDVAVPELFIFWLSPWVLGCVVLGWSIIQVKWCHAGSLTSAAEANSVSCDHVRVGK